MKRLALSLALMTAMVAGNGMLTASAQEAAPAPDAKKECAHKHKKGKYHHGKKAFMKDLNLTAEQEAQIKVIRENFYNAHKTELDSMKAKHKELWQMKKSGADEQAVADKRQQLKSEFAGMKGDKERMMQDIKAVLTPEQVTQLEAKKQQYLQKREQHRQNRPVR